MRGIGGTPGLVCAEGPRHSRGGAVNGAARATVEGAGVVRRGQTGNVRNYAGILGVGVVLLLAWFVIVRGIL